MAGSSTSSSETSLEMWIDSLDWLDLTYPIQKDWNGTAAERVEKVEWICLHRLEIILWLNGPECPKCATRNDASKWTDAPREPRLAVPRLQDPIPRPAGYSTHGTYAPFSTALVSRGLSDREHSDIQRLRSWARTSFWCR
jgi:hypothetical protein